MTDLKGAEEKVKVAEQVMKSKQLAIVAAQDAAAVAENKHKLAQEALSRAHASSLG